ncbi:MAG: hypothetical protein OXU20_28405 [Myxococcales bacterium]|nr:hypothetical protein [Myxococcales bacterium]MDD9967727.1 hypothetical protein [Myxococcales bacterium]
MESDVRARQLARRIRKVRDMAVRAGYLRKMLREMPSERVAEVFVLAVHGAESRDPDHTDLLQCISLALADDACAPLREAVRRHLLAGDQAAPAALLTPPALEPEQEEAAFQVPDFGAGRPLALGERKSLARRRDRDLLARVLRDPHPDVIRIVLLNPTVTENDVLRLSSRRPVRAEVLREVFRSPRWIVRYPIKLALTLNPYAPLDVRLQLAPHLTTPDAERVLGGANLPHALETACRRMIDRGHLH